jgi:hypothetical protein
MTWTDNRSRIARLNRAQRQIDAQYGRTSRYTVYRNGRPYKRSRRDAQQLKESLLMVGVVILGWLCYVMAA